MPAATAPIVCVTAFAMWKPGSLPRGAKWGTGTPHIQLQGVTTFKHGQCG